VNDDWMLEKKFFDVQEMISEKSLWSVVLSTFVNALWLWLCFHIDSGSNN